MDLSTHVTAKLEAATLERFPFPHLIVENFFPDGVYAQILEYNLFEPLTGLLKDLSEPTIDRTRSFRADAAKQPARA